MNNENVYLDLESDVLPDAEYLTQMLDLAFEMCSDLQLRENLKRCTPYQQKTACQLEALLYVSKNFSGKLKAELSEFINLKYHEAKNSELIAGNK